MYAIYKLTSPSGKVYIGQTTNLNKRLNKYKNIDCKAQPAIHSAITKYGWDNMKVDILWCSEDETNVLHILNEFENDFIKIYDCIAPYGYNLRSGGDSFKLSEETKKKISLSSTGKIMSDEAKIKMSIAHTGRIVTDETRNKISESNTGKVRTKETILKMSIPIIQLDKKGNYIKDWDSATIASVELNICRENITSAITGKRKSAGGYTWKRKTTNLQELGNLVVNQTPPIDNKLKQ